MGNSTFEREKSGPQSIKIRVPPSLSNNAEVRKRLSLESVDWQTLQVQPKAGTPQLVPVPKKVKFISYGFFITPTINKIHLLCLDKKNFRLK